MCHRLVLDYVLLFLMAAGFAAVMQTEAMGTSFKQPQVGHVDRSIAIYPLRLGLMCIEALK